MLLHREKWRMQSIISSLVRFISFAVRIYTFVIIARAIVSWVQPNPYNPIVQALYRLTEPVLQPIRRVLFKSVGNVGIDFSPFVAIIVLNIFVIILRRMLLY